MPTPYPFVSGATLLASQMNSLSQLPVVSITSNSTAVATHAYSRVIANGSAISYTIPNNVFEAGQVVEFHNINSTACTIAAGAGVTLNAAAGTTVAQYQSATIYATSASSFILFESLGSTSGVVQVKSTTKIDTFSTTSTTLTDVTGLSVSITPTSASNNVLVIATVTGATTNNADAGSSGYVIVRGSTIIAQNTSLTEDFTGQLSMRNLASSALTLNHAATFLDSPATTSATTYKIQVKTGGTNTIYVNRDQDNYTGSVSSITVFEVAP